MPACKPLYQQAAPHWDTDIILQINPYTKSNFTESFQHSLMSHMLLTSSLENIIFSYKYKTVIRCHIFQSQNINNEKIVPHSRIPLCLSLLFINHQSGINYYKSLSLKEDFRHVMLCIIYTIMKLKLKYKLCPIFVGYLLTFLHFIYGKYYSSRGSVPYDLKNIRLPEPAGNVP